MKKSIFLLGAGLMLLSSCSTSYNSIKAPANYVEFEKEDFNFSEQKSAEAQKTQILGIDWARLFTKKYGSAEGVMRMPVVGNPFTDNTSMYALYNLLQSNPGYDVIFYPQIEKTSKGFWPFYVKTTSKVKARLGKIK